MSVDNDILQEFLIEAGELFEQLDDQLVLLEQQPNDSDLLNAIFRTFHTIKGGAGFMKLIPMVDVCHVTEDVINLLRQGELQVDAKLIDVFLNVLDVVGAMFDQIRSGDELTEASPELLDRLKELCNRKNAPVIEVVSKGEDRPKNDELKLAEIEPGDMDEEFEAMLEAAQVEEGVINKPDDDLINENEFDDLLDSIHGKGKHGVLDKQTQEKKTDVTDPQTTSDTITYDEFESLLDEIHGNNKGPCSHSTTLTQKDEVAEIIAPDVSNKASVNTGSNKSTQESDKTSSIVVAETSVRVDTSRLDDIMNLVGELVLVRNRLSTLKHTIKHDQAIDAISNLELVTSDLQTSVLKTRMQPIKKVFSRFPRVIRDLARKLEKDISLELSGEDTDLDKSLVESLADPLIHLVRNAVDHGIETPDERFASGKPRQGMVLLSAKQQGDQIQISVCDDGRGMNHKVLRGKAVEKGMMNEESANRLSDQEVFNLIFEPGFTTKSQISDVSGRGVGMDVVKTRIEELNGRIDIDSEEGRGSVITIRLPLTLAILPTLMVSLNGYQFALPLSNVNESFNLDTDFINEVDGREVMRVRERPLPIFYLNKWLVNKTENKDLDNNQKVIVVQMRNQQFCLVVDHIIGQEEVVIKPLGTMLYSTPGFSGATITGDGGIALILDIPSLMNAYASGY